MKAEIASHILASAASGERDPIALRATAPVTIVEYSLLADMSPARREV